MKQKKILTSLIIFAGALILSLVTNNVQAASSKLNLGVTKTRYESVVKPEYPTYKYQYEAKDNDGNIKAINVWKIVSYQKAGTVEGQTEADSSKAIYCLKAGLGFDGSFENGVDYSTEALEYSQVYNLKDEADLSILSGYYPNNEVFDNTSEKYMALLWLLDNIYISGESTQTERDNLLKSVTYTDEMSGETKSIYDWMKQTESKNDDLTDSDIDMVQQLAIWYFTNNNENVYNNETLNTIKIRYQASKEEEETELKAYNDIFKEKTEATGETPPLFEGEEDDYINYGRFRENYLKALYQYLITTAKEKAQEGYVGNNETVAAVYLTTTGSTVNQPVVVIDRKDRILDLSLRKFVSKVERNGKEIQVSSREPQVDLSKLISGEVTTATYNQSKEPVAVEEGDLIVYTIRVYNEGNVDAKALEIKEYLPSGLVYTDTSDISWVVENRVAKTTSECKIVNIGGNIEKFSEVNDGKTEQELIGSNLNNVVIPAYEEGKDINYIDILIKCEVTADEGKLVNIAKISKEISMDGFVTKDRDSDPDDKLTIPTDTELPNYTGGGNQGNDPYYDGTNVIEDANGKYYPGQQDDDDFEKIEIKPKQLDLSLVKFVSGVNNTQITEREPQVDTSKLEAGVSTDATYTQVREPLGVEYQDVITYTIRVYNEGRLSGYAAEITDNIPDGLEFIINSEINKTYGWIMLDRDGNQTENLADAVYLTTDYLSKTKETSEGANAIKAFDIGENLEYKDVKIQFRVVSSVSGKSLINEAQVSKETDENGNETTDRDSIPSRDEKYNYEDESKNEDDIDYEQVKIKHFDLAFKKFITGINNTKIAIRVPQVNTSKLKTGEATTATYTSSKSPVEIEYEDVITYTLRVYNEGGVSGYAAEITDNIPEGLEFIATSDTNIKYGWIMLDENGNKTNSSENAKYLTTDYLSKAKETSEGANAIKAYDGGETLDYKDVEIQFKVIYKVTSESEKGKVVINEAQISKTTDENGNENVKDRDSNPSRDEKYNYENPNQNEDDIDYEKIVVRYFDLALKKFITSVNGTPVNNRYPEVKYENDKIIYGAKKEPVEVVKGDIVYYTIRVYNEGDLAGYAYEVTDNIPEGLLFEVNNEVNKKYGWKMLDRNGNEVQNIEDAVYLTTNYLKDTKIPGFDKTKETSDSNPSYADVQIAFKVVLNAKSKEDQARTIINIAQISADSNDDIDSEPRRDDVYNFDEENNNGNNNQNRNNNNNNGSTNTDGNSNQSENTNGNTNTNKPLNEDDIDYEQVKVKYFDLSLLKWVSKTIVTANGQTEESEIGNSGLPTDKMPKVEMKSKEINKVKIKFEYVIKVTNEGQIPGYALEIKDYIPEGLKFVQEDNPDWYEVEEGTIATDKIALQLLGPGESAEVTVILEWINGTENFGEKKNFAEISKDYNDSETPDVDSTPNNKIESEDDMDDAPVILSVKTGQARIYYMLGTIIIVTISVGIFAIKKYVL